MGVGQKTIQYIHERIIKCRICLLVEIQSLWEEKWERENKEYKEREELMKMDEEMETDNGEIQKKKKSKGKEGGGRERRK